MKKVLSALAALTMGMTLTTTAQAEGGGYWEEVERREQLLRDCGSFKQVGMSSVYGAPSVYNPHYQLVGPQSAELDRVKKIKGATRAKVRAIYEDVKQKVDTLDYTQYKNVQMRKRHADKIAVAGGIHANTMQVFRDEQGQLAKEEQYVKQKGYNDVVKVLQGDATYHKDMDEPSSYTHWQECRNWWTEEQNMRPWERNRLR